MRRAVGIFFFLGLLLLAGLTLWIDPEIISLRGGQSYYYIEMKDTEGLQAGAQVSLAGVPAGRITEISVDGNRGLVRATFVLHKGFRLREDSVASLPATSLLGNGRTLALTLGSPSSPKLRAADKPADAVEVRNVTPVVSMDALVAKADKLLASLDSAGPAIKESAENIRNITKKIDSGQGSLGKFVNDDKLYNELVNASGKLDEALTGIRNITSKVEKGEGTIGKLFTDETLYNDLKETTKSLADVSKKLSSGEGALGKLINDPQVYDDIKKASASLAVVMDKVEKGQGTLGMLVNDDSLYKEARRFLKEAREAVEDAREQAPVTAFSSVLFSALQ